jgi:response regulator of citrate/malate metabolism
MASTEGWRMLTTSEPEECLDWVRLDEVDILLVDYHMPVMNGLHVIRKARELSSKLVLIALTVEDGGELASKLTLAGADDFISKPIRLADFTARIRLHEKIFSHREQLNWEERKKGVSKDTMRKVLEKIKDFQAPADCDEIAAACGLAYVTAHRYLEYLSDRGLISRSAGVQDGRPGRPKTYYSIISPSGAQGEKK